MNLFAKNYRWTWHVAFWVTYILLLTYTFVQVMSFTAALTRMLTGLVLHLFFAYTNWLIFIPSYFLKKRYTVYFGSCFGLIVSLGLLRYFGEQSLPVPFASHEVVAQLPLKYIFSFFSFLSIWVLSSLFRLLEDRIKTMQLENELKNAQLHSELRFLKSQINPHFLFNTLNNVYSLAYLKSDRAAPMILKLSGMLRYMIYDCDAPKVSLQKETEYLRDYIDLRVLNPADRTKVSFEIHNQALDLLIEPMLFVNFVENAFKHGNLSEPNAYINVRLTASPGQLRFLIENSIGIHPTDNKAGGIGIQNVRQRLALLYPSKHDLEIRKSNDSYRVGLTINGI